MTPMAHRAPARPFVCPGCATCRRTARRDRLLALAVIAVFVAVFVLRVLVPPANALWAAFWIVLTIGLAISGYLYGRYRP